MMLLKFIYFIMVANLVRISIHRLNGVRLLAKTEVGLGWQLFNAFEAVSITWLTYEFITHYSLLFKILLL